jgi:hypothetical protein
MLRPAVAGTIMLGRGLDVRAATHRRLLMNPVIDLHRNLVLGG